MRKRRRGLLLLVCVLLVGIFTGCQEEKEETADYYIYYLDKDKVKNVAMGYEPKGSDTKELIAEMLQALMKDTDKPDYQSPIPEGVRVENWKLENGQLYLYFNHAYAEMDHIAEVLCRASVVRTLIQIEGVDCISFYEGNAPMADINGVPLGLMTAESFVENPEAQINTILSTEITLYFSNKEGTKLVPEVQKVHYNSSMSMEKLIMENLLKGPKGKELRSAIPKEAKLISVSVLGGVCFVNLDGGFMNQNYEIDESVVIYSIVNSLVELQGINKVQISVNGDSDMIYREEYDLSMSYSRNLDCVESGASNKGEKKKETEVRHD